MSDEPTGELEVCTLIDVVGEPLRIGNRGLVSGGESVVVKYLQENTDLGEYSRAAEHVVISSVSIGASCRRVTPTTP